jgi:hypothetical protein
MINLEDLMQQFDKHESYISNSTDMRFLMYEYGGYNYDDDGDSEQFDFEDDNCIFTVRKYRDSTFCQLVNEFDVWHNEEWIEVSRC